MSVILAATGWADAVTHLVCQSARFLLDMSQVTPALKRKARAIFVVSKRGVSCLIIDTFLADTMSSSGFNLEKTRTRRLLRKNTPLAINTRGAGRDTIRKITMREEVILSFVRS